MAKRQTLGEKLSSGALIVGEGRASRETAVCPFADRARCPDYHSGKPTGNKCINGKHEGCKTYHQLNVNAEAHLGYPCLEGRELSVGEIN